MLTPRQFAEQNQVAYTTVISWLKKNLLPGAQKEALAYGGFMWLVPSDAPKPELKPGPKPKNNGATQTTGKRKAAQKAKTKA